MVAFKEFILSYDLGLIECNGNDNIIEPKDLSKDLNWMDFYDHDHFDEFLHPFVQEISSDFANGKDQSYTYDHHWLMQKVKRHISEFMDNSGLDYRQLCVAILEFLIAFEFHSQPCCKRWPF